MKTSKLFLTLILGGSGVLAGGLLTNGARAQSTTTGAIQGVVIDENGSALPGVTIVTTGQTSQTAITEDDGSYKITGLLPGDYLVTFFYGDTTIERKNINVGVQKTTPLFQKVNTAAAVNETIVINDKPPSIDPTSTTQGITLDREYTKNIPIPGRTFEAALGAAAGSQGDGVGVAFSGSTSVENQYIVDGVNTTGLRFGTVGSPVINLFIEEIEVITGGYNAEYGRATGGVVNVVTKTGTNEFEGELSLFLRPGVLTAARDRTPTQASSIDAQGNLDIDAQLGGVISGPVIKDKLWFVFGFAPSFQQTSITRITKRRTDCRQVMDDGTLSNCESQFANGRPDADPNTGFLIFDDLHTSTLRPSTYAANMLGKINYAVSPEQQGQLSISALPGRSKSYGIYGTPAATNSTANSLTIDVSGKWTSKFNDNKTEVEAVLGFHRESFVAEATDVAARTLPRENLFYGKLGNWANIPNSGEAPETKAGCSDVVGDPYPQIDNCPDDGVGYRVGGLGGFADDNEDRFSARLSVTERVRAAGTHEIKAGMDVENNLLTEPRAYTGGIAFDNLQGRYNLAYGNTWVQVGPPGTEDRKFDEMCQYTPTGSNIPTQLPCRSIGQTGEGSRIQAQTLNWSAYLRDSWQIRPHLTVNYGLRYEEQRLRFADYLRDEIDPITNRAYGTNAMIMRNMWSPRLGVLYDWTREGRSKIYGHWGRFYESIPMTINARSFAGEVNYEQQWSTKDNQGNSLCGPSPDGFGGPSAAGCDRMNPASTNLLGINGSVVMPGIKPQYMDEAIAGVEYELLEDLKLGIAYQNRSIKRVIEDVSTDGALTYIIANPGEWDKSEEAALQGRLDSTDDPAERRRLENQLKLFRGVRMFDKPTRDYHALQFTLTRRFSQALYVQSSYTYSRTLGNYPGLISYDNGQLDPNISSQYDLIELLANRYGPLPQDRPHYIKLDGYYKFDLKKAGQLTVGTRVRSLSGVPRNVLARHARYGTGESFLLPRGQVGRNAYESALDLHLGFSRKLAKGMDLELFGDIFNIFNNQGVFASDNNFSYASASNPIAGGSYTDLVFAKENVLSGADRGLETGSPVRVNPNFGRTSARYSPLAAQVGARLTF